MSESFGLAVGNPVQDSGTTFDITTTHDYARVAWGHTADIGISTAYWAAKKTAEFDKPTLIGEFGCDDKKGSGLLTRAALHAGIRQLG